jgi:hypothetical protein
MAEITMSEVTELTDPKIRKIALRIAKEAELAIEKVAANHTQAAKFPIASNAESFETTLKTRFETLPQSTKQAASIKAVARVQTPPVVRTRHFGDLAGVDLSSDTSIDEQVKAIALPAPLKFSATELSAFTKRQDGTPAASVAEAAQPTTNKLELRIHKVKCVDETNGFLGSEAGDDEIDLAGSTVDETGDVKKVAAFRVGSNFDDGEQKSYSPPKRFTTFSLTEGNAFPKSYFVTLVLSEADMGGLPAFMDKLVGLVKEKVKASLIAAGVAIGSSGGPVGALIGAAVGFIVDRIFALLAQIWNDDIFTPRTLRVNIPSLSARWGGKTDSPEGTLTYSGHGGTYQLTYDWRLFA